MAYQETRHSRDGHRWGSLKFAKHLCVTVSDDNASKRAVIQGFTLRDCLRAWRSVEGWLTRGGAGRSWKIFHTTMSRVAVSVRQ